MSAQCAVITSDVGGITNIVVDGYNGLMTPAGDVEALYQAIKFLLNNPHEMKRLSSNAYEMVKSSFSYEKWKMEWKKVIKEVKQI